MSISMYVYKKTPKIKQNQQKKKKPIGVYLIQCWLQDIEIKQRRERIVFLLDMFWTAIAHVCVLLF